MNRRIQVKPIHRISERTHKIHQLNPSKVDFMQRSLFELNTLRKPQPGTGIYGCPQ